MHSLRYAINIDNLALFMEFEKYTIKTNLFYLLRYACKLKNEVFIDHIINLNLPAKAGLRSQSSYTSMYY